MGIVYLIQQLRIIKERAPRDITPLTRYGSIVSLIDPGDHPSLNSARVRARVAGRLKNFNPEQDYFAWIGGDPVGLVLVVTELLALGHTKVRWLRYARKRNTAGDYTEEIDYIPTRIDLSPYVPGS